MEFFSLTAAGPSRKNAVPRGIRAVRRRVAGVRLVAVRWLETGENKVLYFAAFFRSKKTPGLDSESPVIRYGYLWRVFCTSMLNFKKSIRSHLHSSATFAFVGYAICLKFNTKNPQSI